MIGRFKQIYAELNKDNLEQLSDIYSKDICFIDPFNQLQGLDALISYFSELYRNIDTIHFSFTDSSSHQNTHFIAWEMHLVHPRLNAGNSFCVYGSSHFKTDSNNKIFYHRDYFDAGNMLYEQLPLLKWLIKGIKKKL